MELQKEQLEILNMQQRIMKPDGTINEGHFKDGKLNGQGRITYYYQQIEEGHFKAGKLNGKGKILYNYGQIAEGQFKDGQLNGQGKITYNFGRIEEGHFKDGELNGPGKVITEYGRIDEGHYKDGELNGQGRQIYTNGLIEYNVVYTKGGQFHKWTHITIVQSHTQQWINVFNQENQVMLGCFGRTNSYIEAQDLSGMDRLRVEYLKIPSQMDSVH